MDETISLDGLTARSGLTQFSPRLYTRLAPPGRTQKCGWPMVDCGWKRTAERKCQLTPLGRYPERKKAMIYVG